MHACTLFYIFFNDLFCQQSNQLIVYFMCICKCTDKHSVKIFGIMMKSLNMLFSEFLKYIIYKLYKCLKILLFCWSIYMMSPLLKGLQFIFSNLNWRYMLSVDIYRNDITICCFQKCILIYSFKTSGQLVSVVTRVDNSSQ